MNTKFEFGHALIIGVGADLPDTIKDAQGLTDVLTDKERCAYPPKQVQCLTGSNATRDAILDALDDLAEHTDETSTVVVYFSGHGYQISTSMDDVYFLMPYGYDVNQLKTTAIKSTEFAAKLRAIPAQKLLVLLDCCHAGGVGEAKAPYVEAMTKAPLSPELQAEWAEETAPYLEGRPRQVSSRLQSSETQTHLQQLGELLGAWEAVLAQAAPESEAWALARRVLDEQYEQTAEGLVLRAAAEVPSDSLQSPHDPDAT